MSGEQSGEVPRYGEGEGEAASMDKAAERARVRGSGTAEAPSRSCTSARRSSGLTAVVRAADLDRPDRAGTVQTAEGAHQPDTAIGASRRSLCGKVGKRAGFRHDACRRHEGEDEHGYKSHVIG